VRAPDKDRAAGAAGGGGDGRECALLAWMRRGCEVASAEGAAVGKKVRAARAVALSGWLRGRKLSRICRRLWFCSQTTAQRREGAVGCVGSGWVAQWPDTQ